MVDLVSVVIPIYNCGERIIKSTESILNQTYKNIEVFLIDDGSTDDSLKYCCEIEKEDDRVTVIHTINQGSGPARNEGIKRATGKFIYFPDSDDYVEPETIEVLVKTINEKKCDLVVFGFRYVNDTGRIVKEKKYKSHLVNGDVVRSDYSEYYDMNGAFTIQGAPWNKFFDLGVIKKNNLLYPPLRRHQDEAFIARYVDKCCRVCFLPDVFYSYYLNDLLKQWDKYPIDYLDIIKGLYNDRKNNILQWNSNDKNTHDLVDKEYICGFIKGLELSFSPKYKFKTFERRKWISDKLDDMDITNIIQPDNLGAYQRIVLYHIQKRHINLLYMIFWAKVFIEKRR